MSHRFKPARGSFAPPPSKRGGRMARLRRYAVRIDTQEVLDAILSQQPDQFVANAFLQQVRPYMKFVPRQLQTETAA